MQTLSDFYCQTLKLARSFAFRLKVSAVGKAAGLKDTFFSFAQRGLLNIHVRPGFGANANQHSLSSKKLYWANSNQGSDDQRGVVKSSSGSWPTSGKLLMFDKKLMESRERKVDWVLILFRN